MSRLENALQTSQTFVTASIEAPGQLGTMLSGAAVSLLPPEDGKAASKEFRLVLLDEDLSIIDTLAVHTSYVAQTSYVSHDGPNTVSITGTETKLVDENGVLSVVLVEHHQQRRIGIKFHAHAPTHKLLRDVLPSLQFLALMKYAKSFLIYPRWAAIPYHEAVDITSLSTEFCTVVKRWYDLADSLNSLQPGTQPSLKFPDLDTQQPTWRALMTSNPIHESLISLSGDVKPDGHVIRIRDEGLQ
ncbi:hypothetical protein [Corynebacterium casei]|uniref:hypothetical protein n=2 Tax=Corynebacterium casei TaxID=160386 RepID=UPI002649DFAC|nr:hypothetical protein [Corynebacterium casei]MDN5705853.1 hypothetical protein [Corynebacterium casei]MDN5728773.1 hypothetical protein [Corynebacterium casei]MDN5741109.1 hypothetical protein [Corynebacterium casei]MDN5784275.1 hypothetical protein [Corynebacterium casei]MDN5884336.1 hypothetical protein [Corynebacterium casei]